MGCACRPSLDEGVEVLLSLSCNLAGFTISVPVLGRRQRHRPACRPYQHGLVCQHKSAAGTALQAVQPSSACLPADIVQLQQLVVEKDPHLLQRLAAAGEPPDEPFFRRWLIARRGSAACAAAAIAAHSEWRTALVGVEGRVTEESIPAELASRKVFLQGVDSEGHAVVVVKASRHNMVSKQGWQGVTMETVCWRCTAAGIFCMSRGNCTVAPHGSRCRGGWLPQGIPTSSRQ